MMLCGWWSSCWIILAALEASADCMKPHKKVHTPQEFDSTERGQWRLVGTKGLDVEGKRISRIQGRWIIKEVEFYTDSSCNASSKVSSNKADANSLVPIITKYGDYSPFLSTDCYESEIRMFDEDVQTKFWSTCYQSEDKETGSCGALLTGCCKPWFGIRLSNTTNSQIKCVKLLQSESEQYQASEIHLQKWIPNASSTWAPIADANMPDDSMRDVYVRTNDAFKHAKRDGDLYAGQWQVKKIWTNDQQGGSWIVLKDTATHAVAAAHRWGLSGKVWLLLAAVLGSQAIAC